MGTSSHNPGQSGHSPLVPSWVDDNNTSVLAAPIAPNADPSRFSVPKGNMTRFAGSGSDNGNGNLRSAASQYVRSSTGGARNATARFSYKESLEAQENENTPKKEVSIKIKEIKINDIDVFFMTKEDFQSIEVNEISNIV